MTPVQRLDTLRDMIDIKEIRENPEKFKAACEAKGFNVDIDNPKLKESLYQKSGPLSRTAFLIEVEINYYCTTPSVKVTVLLQAIWLALSTTQIE